MTRRRDVKLLNSLINYVLDVKPYHSKLREFTSELFFEDKFNANLQDAILWDIHHQNIWTRSDLGGYLLVRTAEGLSTDKIFRIPATIFPRFSLNGDVVQTPPGYDVEPNLTDGNAVNSSELYPNLFGPSNSSHQLGKHRVKVKADVVSDTVVTLLSGATQSLGTYSYSYDISTTVDPGLSISLFGFGVELEARFSRNDNVNVTTSVSVTNIGNTYTLANEIGSYTPTVEDFQLLDSIGIKPTNTNAIAAFCLEKRKPKLELFYLNTGRYSVAHHTGSTIKVNGTLQVFGVDYIVDGSMSFIQFLPGNHPAADDEINVNLFKNDRLFISYLQPFNATPSPDYFTITVDNDFSGRSRPVDFINTQPGTTKARLIVDDIKVDATNGDVWRITATSMYTFSVQKIEPTIGLVQTAYFRQPFSNSEIAFTIDRVWSNYYFIQDADGYQSYDLNSYSLFPYGGLVEATNFFPSLLNTITEHGVITDPAPPNHAAVEMVPFGKIKKKTESTIHGLLEYYIFELNNTPPRGTYIELRVEQNNQLNPRLNAAIQDKVRFTDLINYQEFMCSNSQFLFGQYASSVNDPPLSVIVPPSYYSPSSPVSWPITGTWPTFIFDLPLIDIVCTFIPAENGYDLFLYDEELYDVVDGQFYAAIIDDMYLTINFVAPASTKIIHNVRLHPEANFFQEPNLVNELVINHGRGIAPTSVDVYFMGAIIVPDLLILDSQRAIITLNTSRSIAVKLNF